MEKDYCKSLITIFTLCASVSEHTKDDTAAAKAKEIYESKPIDRICIIKLLAALGLAIKDHELDAAIYIMQNVNLSDNLYIGTITATAEATGVSANTVFKTLKKLRDANVVVKKQSGVYMINPAHFKGNSNMKRLLIDRYERLKEEQSNCSSKIYF